MSLYQEYGQGTKLNSFTLDDIGELILLQPEDDLERMDRVYLDRFLDIPFEFIEKIGFAGREFYHAVVIWDEQFATGFYSLVGSLDEKVEQFLEKESTVL